MTDPQYDSTRWTGKLDLAPPAAPASPLVGILTGDQRRSTDQTTRVALALVLLAGSVWSSSWLYPGLLIAAPPLAPYAFTIGIGLLVLTGLLQPKWSRLARHVGKLSLILVLVMAAAYPVLISHASETAVPVSIQRAQIVDIQRHGRSAPPTVTFLMGDGRMIATKDYLGRQYGALTRCFEMQELRNWSGFVWLRIVDASPLPQSGQLAWPIDQKACFSSTPLAEMSGE